MTLSEENYQLKLVSASIVFINRGLNMVLPTFWSLASEALVTKRCSIIYPIEEQKEVSQWYEDQNKNLLANYFPENSEVIDQGNQQGMLIL